MKRFFVLMTSVLMVLCLTSCFEFVQSISLEGESYHIKRQISFSKYFLAMMMSGESDSSEALSLKEFETEFDKLAETMGAESFHTPSESGIISTMIINKDTQNEEELASLPRKDGTKFIIPLIDMTETAEKAQTDWDSLMAAYILLSTAEYQLTLGKEIVPHISYAYLIEQNSNEQYLVSVMDNKFTLIDTIAPDFILSDQQYWMYALRNGARTYQAHWEAPDNNPKYNNIEEIWLGIEAKNSYSNEGYIWIEYKFSNADEAQDSFDDIL